MFQFSGIHPERVLLIYIKAGRPLQQNFITPENMKHQLICAAIIRVQGFPTPISVEGYGFL